jgi:signal transduction histidine kinase
MTETLTQIRAKSGGAGWDLTLTVLEHEMRTPLAAALMQLNVVERSIQGAGSLERAQTVLAGAKRQIMTLSQVLRRVVELQTRGTVQISPHVVDLGQLAGDLVCRLRLTNPGLWSRVEVEAAAGVSGSWDGSAIEEILENLLSNALKFGKEGPVRLVVVPARTGVRVTVQDSGMGISRADHGRIFGLLGRGASASHIQGHGIGLWMVRHLVRAHGGRIRVKSRVGAGAAFEVWLPRFSVAAGSVRAASRRRCRNVSPAPRRRAH